MVGGHEELVVLRVSQLQILAFGVADRSLYKPDETRDAMFRMHDVVVGAELGKKDIAIRRAGAWRAPPLLDESEDLRIG